MDSLMSRDKVAKFFNISLVTLHVWIKKDNGFPKPIKIGGRPFWKKSDIEEYLEKGGK